MNGLPTSFDIYIEEHGQKVAVVQSYQEKQREDGQYAIHLDWVYPVFGMLKDSIHELDDFSLVVCKPDRKIVYSGCKWSVIEESGTLWNMSIDCMSITAKRREEVEDNATGKEAGIKSLFCEQIGVASGQPFIVRGYPYRNYPPMVYDEDGCVRLYSPDGQKRHKVGGRAIAWIVDHPESVEPCKGYTPQAAALKKEEPMEKKEMPRICEVLGVEVGQRFTVDGYCPTVKAFWITEDGLFETNPPKFPGTSCAMMQAINHPDRIIRKPRFTEEEVAVARSLYRVWPDGKLLRRAKADLVLTSYHYGFTMPVPQDMFSSLCQGQSITLCDIVGGEP